MVAAAVAAAATAAPVAATHVAAGSLRGRDAAECEENQQGLHAARSWLAGAPQCGHDASSAGNGPEQ